MRRRVPESPVRPSGQSHSLSGCDESQSGSAGSFAGIHVEVVEVLDYGDGSVLTLGEEEPPNLAVPCDDPSHGHAAPGVTAPPMWAVCDGWRLILGPGQRSFIPPESAGPVVGAGPAQTSGGVR